MFHLLCVSTLKSNLYFKHLVNLYLLGYHGIQFLDMTSLGALCGWDNGERGNWRTKLGESSF